MDHAVKNDLTCSYCLRAFQYRDLLLQHEISCEYFLSGKRVREMDALEDLPSGQDQFKWIQALALRVGDLERNVSRLRLTDHTRRRNGIRDWLRNPLCPRPCITLTEWLMQLPVDVKQLDCLSKDLVEIMQDLLLNVFREQQQQHLPLCAFAGCKTLYAWDLEPHESSSPVWINVTLARWDKYFAKFQHSIRKALQWNANDECDEAQREGWLLRLRKVNEKVATVQKNALYAWLRKRFEQNSPVIT